MLRYLSLLFLLFAQAGPLRADVMATSGAALARLLSEGVPIIDIRRPEEWRQTGIIEGSHLMTFFDAQGRYDVPAWLAKFSAVVADRDQPFILVCRTGNRTGTVSRFLSEKLGYRKVHDVEGGIVRWMGEGRPTVAPPARSEPTALHGAGATTR